MKQCLLVSWCDLIHWFADSTGRTNWPAFIPHLTMFLSWDWSCLDVLWTKHYDFQNVLFALCCVLYMLCRHGPSPKPNSVGFLYSKWGLLLCATCVKIMVQSSCKKTAQDSSPEDHSNTQTQDQSLLRTNLISVFLLSDVQYKWVNLLLSLLTLSLDFCLCLSGSCPWLLVNPSLSFCSVWGWFFSNNHIQGA